MGCIDYLYARVDSLTNLEYAQANSIIGGKLVLIRFHVNP